MSEENIERVIEKKVTINEDKNEEKVIENIEEIKKLKVNRHVCLGFLRLIETSVSRGVYKPYEVLNVGKVYDDYMSQINLGDELNEYELKLDSINNIRILVELTISRGGFTAAELSSVGELYNIIISLLK